jgi:transcriptional regulator with XRE-family HTH domain
VTTERTTERRTAADRRRPELAAFLRSRRARVSPEDVGMPPGPRRRTPGLRREEVAQLAGVGVTWYTWLEQGRPINASAQVLDAVARTLRLDAAEREHLYRLAEVPYAPGPGDGTAGVDRVRDDVQAILDALHPLPAVIYNARYDVLGHNANYAALFRRGLGCLPLRERNVLRLLFASDAESCPVVFREAELKRMVAVLRAGYGRHVGEPAWEAFITELAGASPEFAAMWRSGDVAPPGPQEKTFRHPRVGLLRLRTESLSVNGMPEARMVVYVPADDASRAAIDRLGPCEARADARRAAG